MIRFLLLLLLCMPIYSPGAALAIMTVMLGLWLGLDLPAATILTIGIGAVLMYAKSVAKAG